MTLKTRVAVADFFWSSMIELPKAQQKKVVSFVSKFRQAPTSNAINYEKINSPRHPDYRSVRIDQAYRCIVLAPSQGNIYVLLWVDHHDDAYDWAKRTRCEVHPVTGALQVFESVVGEETATPDAVSGSSDASDSLHIGSSTAGQSADNTNIQQAEAHKTRQPQQAESSTPLFNLDDTRLLGIGVPESMMQRVMQLRSVQELISIESQLPIEAYEALYLFAEGCDWNEIWDEYGSEAQEEVDTNDIEAALERDTSKRRFKVVDSDKELQEILSAPLEMWRVYLHPTQRTLVERDWNGPVRVLGGAGTGKTVVAMHRAAWLVRNRLSDNGKVLFLTYNTNLASDIKQNLAKITTKAELDRIEVINIDAWVSRFLKAQRYTSRLVFEGELDKLWDDIIDASASLPDKMLPASFYKEEWERVILPNRINSREDYLRVSRAGRGVPLARRQRAVVWEVFDEVRSEMQRKGWRTYQDGMLDAMDLVKDASQPMDYRHVIVDEAQDMGGEALMLIRALAPEDVNDLFLVGDGHQRIYRRRAVMGRCGIKIVGRSRKLKINYRTTEQIRRFATAVLDGQLIDNLDDGEDTSTAYRSLTQGLDPELQGFDSEAAEVKWIAQRAESLVNEGGDLANCCVLLRTKALRDSFANGLRGEGLDVVTLDTRADNQSIPGIRLASMHRIKGLEFRHVFLASMNDGVIPNLRSIQGSEDSTELRDKELSERALVHVAASRAIEGLYVTWHGQKSEYLVG